MFETLIMDVGAPEMTVEAEAASRLLGAAMRKTADETRSLVDHAGVTGLAASAGAIAASLRGALEPNWPYPWDADHVLVRRRGWLRDRLVVLPVHPLPAAGASPFVAAAARPAVPANGAAAAPGPRLPVPVPAPVPAAPAPWALAVFRFMLTVAATAAVILLAQGKFPKIHWSNPFVSSAAYRAGEAERGAWIANIAAAFDQAANDVSGGRPLEDAKADHVKRLQTAVRLPDSPALTAELDRAFPPGGDPKTITSAQRASYASALRDFGAGIKGGRGWLW